MTIRASKITTTSFVVQWDEVDHADQYIVNWKDGNGVDREAITSRTSHTITELSPNMTYYVNVSAINICGAATSRDFLLITTNTSIVIKPSHSTSTMTSLSTSNVVHLSMPTTSSTHTPTDSINEQCGNAFVYRTCLHEMEVL